MTTPENFAYIAHLSQRQGQSVTIRGWLYNKRSSGKVRFLLIRDGTGIVQGVMVKGHLPEGGPGRSPRPRRL